MLVTKTRSCTWVKTAHHPLITGRLNLPSDKKQTLMKKRLIFRSNVQRFLASFFFREVFGRARRYLDWLCCVVLCCILLSVLYCVVLCCVVICVLFVSLVCWLKISQFSSTFVARLDATTRRTDSGSISSTNSTTVRPTPRLATRETQKYWFSLV